MADINNLGNIIAVTGHYGSGKTNLAVNLAVDFTDLPHELAEQFAEQFRQPEMFMRVDGKIVATPMPEEQTQGGMSY